MPVRRWIDCEIELKSEDNRPYIGRFTGRLLAAQGDREVYETAKGQLLVYTPSTAAYETTELSEESLGRVLQGTALEEARQELGMGPPVRDLDV